MSHTIARTNYVLVKDIEAFKAAIPEDVTIEVTTGAGEQADMVALLMENGLWESCYNEDTEEDEPFDAISLLAEHLVEGQVAVFQEVGHDKMRFMVGSAVAVDHTGATVEVCIDDIYAKAAEAFKTDRKAITDASY